MPIAVAWEFARRAWPVAAALAVIFAVLAYGAHQRHKGTTSERAAWVQVSCTGIIKCPVVHAGDLTKRLTAIADTARAAGRQAERDQQQVETELLNERLTALQTQLSIKATEVAKSRSEAYAQAQAEISRQIKTAMSRPGSTACEITPDLERLLNAIGKRS
jgi:hypothetical protein